MKKILSLLILICLVSLLFISCNQNPLKADPDDEMGSEINSDEKKTPEINSDEEKAPEANDGDEKNTEYGELYYAIPVRVVTTYSDCGEIIQATDCEGHVYETVSPNHNHVDEVVYNERNLPVKQTVTLNTGRQYTYEYEYDDNSNIIRKAFSGSEKVIYEYKYIYDENNRLVKRIFIHNGTENNIVEYAYDENGNLTYESELTVWSDMKIVNRYTYDDSGKLIKDEYSTSFESYNDTDYIYNDKGQVVRINESCGGGKYIPGNHDLFYDEAGNLTKKIFNTKDRTNAKKYSYDERGNLIRVAFFQIRGNYINCTTDDYEYDENNNMIKHVYIDGEGNRFVFEYEYDTYGNVVKRVYTNHKGVVQTTTVEYDMVYIPFELSDEILKMFKLEYYTIGY